MVAISNGDVTSVHSLTLISGCWDNTRKFFLFINVGPIKVTQHAA